MLPILRSRHQADLLTQLLLHPDREYTITELGSLISIPQSTVSEEVQRLAETGIITVRSVGRSRLVRANSSSKLVAPLTELIILTFGPHVVITEEFAQVPGVERVLIYGSWAARYAGTRGAPPNDVDVLVVGSPDRAGMHLAAERAENRLGRPVNPVARSPADWAAAADQLVREIQSHTYVTVLEPGPTKESA